MDSNLAVLALGLGVVAVAGIGILGAIAARRRRDAMAAYAASRGWRYLQEEPSLAHRFSGSPFGLGHSRRAYNVLSGRHDGREALAFDYVYETTSGSGKEQRTETHHYSVVAMSVGAPVPNLQVTPQNLITGWFGRITNRDIELESEDFNRAFVITCDDRKFASDVLHPRMMELVRQWPEMAWRFDSAWMLSVRSGQLEPPQIDEKLHRLDAILDAVPDFVWREVRGR